MSDTGFISLPIETDEETLTANALDSFTTYYPGWQPKESNLEVQLVEVTSRNQSIAATVASIVSQGVFRYFGKVISRVNSIEAQAATVTTTWTLLDTNGHTIPQGTPVYYRVNGDTNIAFRVQSDVVVAPGSSTTADDEVILVAVTPGTEANGLTAATMYLVTSLSWVNTVTSTATTAGGVDAESDPAYLDRLRERLTTLSPAPILPNDFAILAKDTAGVGRSLGIDGYDIGKNEKQQVAITGSPTGGTFTLTYSGQTTSAIAYNASASTIQSALEALSNIAVGDVACTGGSLPATAVVVEFKGALATTNVASMTHTDSLTGGSTPAVVLTTPVTGVAPSSNNARTVTVAVVQADGTPVGVGVKEAVVADLTSLREANFVVYAIDPTYTTVNVTATIKVLPGFNSTDVQANCVAALTAYLSPANWDWAATVYRNELITLLSNVIGVDRVVTLTTPAADLSLTGVANLPMAGTFSIGLA
jgi:hypothetical protein